MPQVKSIPGHTKLSGAHNGGCYLEYQKDESGVRTREAGSRALAHDFLNLREVNGPAELTWFEQMDKTREDFGNDVPVRSKRVRTYQQYVISPDPRDRCDLQTLRDITMEWARKWFSDYEVAIVYHDDNENHVLHAHVIVNNTNLETGSRLAPYLTKQRAREINQSMQKIAQEHGLRAYDDTHASRTGEEMRNAGTSVNTDASPVRDHLHGRSAPNRSVTLRVRRTKAERELIAKGLTPWKDELRSMLDTALMTSENESEFLSSLRNLGVIVTESKDSKRRGRPDWVFELPDNTGARRARGSRLGRAYSRDTIVAGFALGRDAIRSAYEDLDIPAPTLDRATRHNIIRGLTYVGTIDRGGDVTLDDVRRMLDYTNRHGLKSYRDLSRRKDDAAKDALETARAMGAFDYGRWQMSDDMRSDAAAIDEILRMHDERITDADVVDAARHAHALEELDRVREDSEATRASERTRGQDK